MASTQFLATAAFVGKSPVNPNVSPTDIFKDSQNHAIACASVLTFSQRSSDWNPNSESPEDGIQRYATKVATFPGFISTEQKDLSYQVSPAAWNVYLNALLEKLTKDGAPVATTTARELFAGLEDTLKERKGNEKQGNVELFLQLIQKEDESNDVNYSNYRIKLTISDDSKGAITITNGKTEVHYQSFRVGATVLTINADRFAQSMPIVPLTTWCQDNTTQKRIDAFIQALYFPERKNDILNEARDVFANNIPTELLNIPDKTYEDAQELRDVLNLNSNTKEKVSLK